MTHPLSLELPAQSDEALEALRAASRDAEVVVFKKSPTCPVSHRAEFEFKSWVKELGEDSGVRFAVIDVLAERSLARGLTTALDVKHESPQALWFSGGELAWHDSHGALTRDRFAQALGQ